jgi:hypothetical protein
VCGDVFAVMIGRREASDILFSVMDMCLVYGLLCLCADLSSAASLPVPYRVLALNRIESLPAGVFDKLTGLLSL